MTDCYYMTILTSQVVTYYLSVNVLFCHHRLCVYVITVHVHVMLFVTVL